MKFIIVVFLGLLLNTMCYCQSSGTFTDSRDGKVYKTVEIGTQVWMGENLAFRETDGCWAYEDSQDNVSSYGFLYSYRIAVWICPEGWHLPSDDEWTELFSYNGGIDSAGTKLISNQSLNRDDTNFRNELGFNALPGGFRDLQDEAYDLKDGRGVIWTGRKTNKSRFNRIGENGYWWSSERKDNWESFFWSINWFDKGIDKGSGDSWSFGCSIRCIKDQ